MLLMSTAFRPGECLNFIQNLKNQDMQKMAYCEYYYFTGEHDKAVDLAELYLSHPDPMLPAFCLPDLYICQSFSQ